MANYRLLAAMGMLASAAAAVPARADVVVGPRFSYYFDNSNLRSTDLTSISNAEIILEDELEAELESVLGEDVSVVQTGFSDAQRAEQIGFPMLGGMVNFGNDRDRFTLTAMYGSGGGSIELVSSRSVKFEFSGGEIGDVEVNRVTAQTEIDRIDIEATWQRRVNENFAITGGIRYERLDRRDSGLISSVQSNQILVFLTKDPSLPLLLGNSEITVDARTTVATYTARIGGTAFVPVDSAINAFFSGMVQAGYQPNSEQQITSEFLDSSIGNGPVTFSEELNGELSVGPDMAVGLQILLGQDIAIDMRYRAVVVFPLSGDFEFSDARVNHGVNLGLSLRL